eukprot:gene51527-63014_t
MGLDRAGIDLPHALAHGAPLVGDGHPEPAAVSIKSLATDKPSPLKPIDEAREVILGKQGAGLDFEGAQLAAVRLYQFPEHVVPAKRRQASLLEVSFDRLEHAPLRAHEADPGLGDSPCRMRLRILGKIIQPWRSPVTSTLTLVSHHLCPYVQRAAIALAEKNVAFDRVNIDLAAKPDWFLNISPLGKVPLLQIPQTSGEAVLFESSVICEYLEETQTGVPLHPTDALERARHRGWMEYGSSILSDLWGFETTGDADIFEQKRQA